MSDLLAKLQEMQPASIWTLAPKPLIMQGSGLLATGDISALRWTGTTQLEVEFPNRLGVLVHRLRLEGDRITGMCDRHGQEVCAHHLAGLMLAMHLLKDFGAFGRFPNRVQAEHLKTALLRSDARAIQRDESQRPPREAQKHILIRPDSTQLFFFRDSFGNRPADAYATVPQEVRGFTSQWAFGDREDSFWRWFTDPISRFPVFIEVGQEIVKVERPHSSGWSGELSLCLGKDEITVQRQVLQHGQPVDDQLVSVGESLIFLPKSEQLIRMSGKQSWELWHRLRSDISIGRGPSIAFSKAHLSEPLPADGRLTLSIPEWNALDFEWPAASGKSSAGSNLPRLEQDGKTIAGPTAVKPRAQIALSPSEDPNFLDVEVTMHIGEETIGCDAAALNAENTLETMCPDPQLLAAKGRREAVTTALFRTLLTKDAAERRQIEADLAANDIFKTKHQSKLAARLITAFLDAENTDTAPAKLVVSPEHGWSIAPGVQEVADEAGALARLVLGARHPFDLEFPDYEDNVYCAPIAEALGRLPVLAAECKTRGISLSFSDKPINISSLNCSVTATKAEGLDFFELKPEVRSNGELIPQEQWENLVLKGHMFEEDGSLRVIDLGSLTGLNRLTDILKRQQREQPDASGKKSKRIEELVQIPRVRILDWLMLQKHGVECHLPEAERAVLDSLMNFEELGRDPLPFIKATLRDYQHAGYSWLAFLYKHGFGACLADDMGLGKTLQTITLLAGIKEGIVKPLATDATEQRPHLLVVPPTLLFNWQNEIKTFCPSIYVHEYTGKGRSLIGIKEGVVLTTYDLARRDIETLREHKFDCVIFDEAQAVKNLLGERSKAMRQLQGRFKIALTGTPLENHAGEYFSIIELALPGIFGDYHEFLNALKKGGGGFNPLDRARPFVLRRTKEKILKELPPKVESDMHLNLTEEQKRFYTRAVADVRAEVLEAFKDKTAQQAGIVALSALTRLRQICVSPALIDPAHTETSPKMQYLVDKLSELAAEGHAALVFSQFTKSLDHLETHLAAAALKFQRLDGSTPQQKRKTLVEAFQSDTGPGIFLISLKAGGAGLNLTRASYVFHLDPWWNPAVENQASDRAHRMGQKQTVFIQRLLMRHTIEEKIMQLKAKKSELFDRVLSGADGDRGTTGSIITREDLSFLLD